MVADTKDPLRTFASNGVGQADVRVKRGFDLTIPEERECLENRPANPFEFRGTQPGRYDLWFVHLIPSGIATI
jgi:hypothetical protein